MWFFVWRRVVARRRLRMERQQQVSEILRRNCREAIFALIIIVEDSCHTQQRIHERLFQMQAGVVYGHPYNQQAFTGVQVRLCLERLAFTWSSGWRRGPRPAAGRFWRSTFPAAARRVGSTPTLWTPVRHFLFNDLLQSLVENFDTVNVSF